MFTKSQEVQMNANLFKGQQLQRLSVCKNENITMIVFCYIGDVAGYPILNSNLFCQTRIVNKLPQWRRNINKRPTLQFFKYTW